LADADIREELDASADEADDQHHPEQGWSKKPRKYDVVEQSQHARDDVADGDPAEAGDEFPDATGHCSFLSDYARKTPPASATVRLSGLLPPWSDLCRCASDHARFSN
jgi:hypothetical protein